MGNRAVVIITDGAEYSPSIYLHWEGSPDQVQSFVDEWTKLMKDRQGDLSYCTARLIGVIHSRITGDTGLGVWTNEVDSKESAAEQDQGDNGVYLVDCNTFKMEHLK